MPYHVTHRGNRRGAVFFCAADYDGYLRRLARVGRHYGLELWAYCLMSNHVHLVVRPRTPDALARTIGEVHGHYARALHAMHGWNGHVWANRYFSAALDRSHLWAAVRYVERNPVRAGLAEIAETYPWSSAAAHCGLASDELLAPNRPFPGRIPDWRAWLAENPESSSEEAIRSRTASGLPAGGAGFVQALERRLGRRFTPSPMGRPPANSDAESQA